MKHERGAAVVEFALIAPLIILLILGLLEFGLRYQRQAQLNNAAFVAARTVAAGKVADAQTKGAAALPPGPSMSGTPAWAGITACTEGNNVTVTLTVTMNSPTSFFGGPTYSASATGVSRCGG